MPRRKQMRERRERKKRKRRNRIIYKSRPNDTICMLNTIKSTLSEISRNNQMPIFLLIPIQNVNI